MHTKRNKKSRIRAAKVTAGTGGKKKHRGTGHQGGAGLSSIGKRGSAKIMKITKGDTKYLGRYGFKTLRVPVNAINLTELQNRLDYFVEKGKANKADDMYEIDLGKLGFDKLLSKGNISLKVQVKVKSATDNAIARIEKAGGKVIKEE
jgi:large subunit ribosomal protein L15